MAVFFYRFVKGLEYHTANPGQDFNEHEADGFEFDEENAASAADVARPVERPVGASSSNMGASTPAVGRGMSMSPVETTPAEENVFEKGPAMEMARAEAADKAKEA